MAARLLPAFRALIGGAAQLSIEFAEAVGAYEASYEEHRENCRRAFETCEIFIFTLGMSEVWEYKLDGPAMAMEPKAVPPFLVNQRGLTTADNVEELERAFASTIPS